MKYIYTLEPRSHLYLDVVFTTEKMADVTLKGTDRDVGLSFV